jgi:1-acyl-sn-glycerol-3-phosphate acyltransferase
MVYRLLRVFFSLYLRIFHLLRVRGTSHIPKSGPVILCANHSSYFDSMLLAVCCPRKVRFLITKDFYHHPLLGWFVKQCGSIPVTHSGTDKEALSNAIAILREGAVLGIFPEGGLTRTGLPGPGKSGAAMLAAATNAAIVPVTIAGAFAVYPKGKTRPGPGKISVTVHPPVIAAAEKRRDKSYLQLTTDLVMTRISRRLAAYGRYQRNRRKTVLR